MGATSDNISTPKRQSCDRCHNQKVRCTRTVNYNTGACDKCLRKDVLCIYSSCLPKGRPSLYRTSDVSRGSEGPSNVTSATWTPPETVPGSPKDEDTQYFLPISLSTASRAGQQPKDLPSFSHAGRDAGRGAEIDLDPHEDAGIFPDFTENVADSWSSWWPHDHIADSTLDLSSSWALNQDPAVETQPPSGFGLSEPPPHRLDGISKTNHGAAGHNHRSGEAFDRGKGGSGTSGKSGSSGRAAWATDKSEFKLSIAHLSQLSVRLSQLLGSSRSFLTAAFDPSGPSKSHDAVRQVELGIEAVFRSVNSWLVHGTGNANLSSGGDMGPGASFDLPHHVFSASNRFLGILHHIGINAPSSTSSSSGTSSISSGSYEERSPTDGSQRSSSSVVNHLVVTCSTLLLNVYIAILVALQRSADALNSSPRPRITSQPVESNGQMDSTSRVHLQLVSVVELCSHFIKRQNQILDLVTSSSCQGPLQPPSLGGHDSQQSAAYDDMSALRTEVKERLRHLQETLLYNPLA